ncbi:MAG: DUF3379 family protein [Lysobacterales bacterium]|jgi:hypothetical protein
MSTNFSDFRRLLGADPYNRDDETLRARTADPEFEAAAQDAEDFEKKLEGALHIQAPVELLDDIRRIPARRRNWIPLAMAASVLIAVGAAIVAFNQPREWASVEAYVADHYAHDGAKVMASAASSTDTPDTERILARLDASADRALAKNIRFIKFCPTPDGRGAHMVLETEHGLVTVILMPRTNVTDGQYVSFDGMRALMVTLERGSAAIIAAAGQPIGNLPDLLRRTLVIA